MSALRYFASRAVERKNRQGYISPCAHGKEEEDRHFHWLQLGYTRETQLLWNYPF
jgi:hypothetical protein